MTMPFQCGNVLLLTLEGRNQEEGIVVPLGHKCRALCDISATKRVG